MCGEVQVPEHHLEVRTMMCHVIEIRLNYSSDEIYSASVLNCL